MYVLIDRDALVFRHAHPDHSVISGLAHIEVAHCAVAIYDVHGDHDFISFTDLELSCSTRTRRDRSSKVIRDRI